MTSSGPTRYDLVLVFTAFQRNCIYAAIIKELGWRLRIGILPIDRDKNTESRAGKTNRLFLELCESLGAEIIGNEPVQARLEILAQSNYRPEDIELIDSTVKADKTFWMSGVAMGNAFFSSLFSKPIDKILVPDRQLYDHRLRVYGDDGVRFPDTMIQEIGMPYDKYPLFVDDFDADYILAHPTPFSFTTPEDRLDYLENVLQLVKRIAARGEIIAFKPHNADERADYIVNARYYAVLRWPAVRPLHGLIDKAARSLRGIVRGARLRSFLTELSIVVAYDAIMDHVVHLKDLTHLHNLNLEIFLPRARQGLITGRSNSIWHGLLLRKSVWNCIDRDKPYLDADKMHSHTMKYLNVHGNYRDLTFDAKLFDIIADSTRKADLIEFLSRTLHNASDESLTRSASES